MKKIITTLFAALVAVYGHSQTNTFPANGNAGIGETSAAALTVSNPTAYTNNEILRLKSGIAWGGNF